MPPFPREYDHTGVWGVVRPAQPSRVAGVTMAGFLDRGRAPNGHRVIPHPAVTVALDFGPDPPVVDDAAGRRHRGSLAMGLGPPGTVWARGANLQCVQVRMSPVVAGALLGVRPSDLDGVVVRLDDLWGRAAPRIAERLAEASTWQDRFTVIDTYLARHRVAGPLIDPEVSWAWGRIVASRGRVRANRLAAELGWSRKRLWSRFGSQIGLPPKRAAKLVRFDHAAHRLAAGLDVARAAAASGYADQPHLHRDSVAFAGVTPTALADEPWLTVDDVAWPRTGY